MKITLYCGGEIFAVETVAEEGGALFSVNEQPYGVEVLSLREGSLTLLVDGHPVRVYTASRNRKILVALLGKVYEFAEAGGGAKGFALDSGRRSPEVLSPMPGKILEVCVTEGKRVEEGEPLLLLEAMKMENILEAEGSALVKRVHVRVGDVVEPGQILVELEFGD